MLKKILCVDDEPKVLGGLERSLGFDFDVHVASSGPEGLEILADEGPFAVIVSDMRMPEMDGATFLQEARSRYPDTTRVLLTGYSDVQAAIRAVNEGQIFRFLAKPCAPDLLRSSIQNAAEQYRLINAERELLEKTVAGSVRALIELLELVSPVAFGQTTRIRQLVMHVAEALNIDERWQYETAANLSQVGCIALSQSVVERGFAGQPMADEDARLFARHPSLAASLIDGIPRLEVVASIVARQAEDFPGGDVATAEPAVLGGIILRGAREFDRWVSSGKSAASAISRLRQSSANYPSALVDALETAPRIEAATMVRSIQVDQLVVGMTLVEALSDTGGVLLAAAGHEVTPISMARLRNIARLKGVREPFVVRMTTSGRSALENSE